MMDDSDRSLDMRFASGSSIPSGRTGLSGRFSDSDEYNENTTDQSLNNTDNSTTMPKPHSNQPKKFGLPNENDLLSGSRHYDGNGLNFDNNDEELPTFSGWTSLGAENPTDVNFDEPVPKLQNTPIDDFISPPELVDLFSLINEHTPQQIEISPHWKPFLPDFVPSIGAIDAFIKVPRPDNELDPLGLTVVDEPSIGQSNNQILKMELCEKYGISLDAADGKIGEVRSGDTKALDSWLDSIEDIYRNRPPPTMTYTTQMPELEHLMEVWPRELEELLQTIPIPGADIDLTLTEYAKVICAFLDIPVRGNIIESLHHLFSLYMSFEDNLYFQNAGNADKTH